MATICGSDLHIWRGHGPKIETGIPQVLGHVMIGTIEAMGHNVKSDSSGQPLSEGDRIVYSYFKPCKQCWTCLNGKPGCPDRYRDWIGVSSDQPPHAPIGEPHASESVHAHALFGRLHCERAVADLPSQWARPQGTSSVRGATGVER